MADLLGAACDLLAGHDRVVAPNERWEWSSTATGQALGGRVAGRQQTVLADGRHVEAVKELTDGAGARVVVDFLAEEGAEDEGFAMTRPGGAYSIIGYGGEPELRVPAFDIISTARSWSRDPAPGRAAYVAA